MKTNKISIYIFIILSILSLILSIVTTIILEDKILSWVHGFSFALFGSSLISMCTAIINYKVKKRNYSEKICIAVIHMNEDAQTELYLYNKERNIEKIVRTINICCNYCNDILNILNIYMDGLFIFNIKEKKLISKFMGYMQEKQLLKYRKLGARLKKNKKQINGKLLNFYNKLYKLLNDNEIKEFAQSILKKNKSNIIIKSDKKTAK